MLDSRFSGAGARRRFQRGVVAIEYALLGVLVVLGAAAAMTVFGDALGSLFESIKNFAIAVF